jgi:hypothetical protein
MRLFHWIGGSFAKVCRADKRTGECRVPDTHKWLNVNYDSGIVMVRDGMALRRASTVSAPYLHGGAQRELMNHAQEASRRARGVELWAALKNVGRSGVRDLIERTCARAARFELLNDVVLNQVLVSFGDGKKAGSHSKGSGRCHLLVWRHGMAWPHRETHQPGVVGDDRIGHRQECRCGDSNCA